MDRGTNALRVLKNEVVPLRLGYIGELGCLLTTFAHLHILSDQLMVSRTPQCVPLLFQIGHRVPAEVLAVMSDPTHYGCRSCTISSH